MSKRVFSINSYLGVDPTGKTPSDAAVIAAFQDAQASLAVYGGATVTCLPGEYLVSLGKLVVPDGRIAFRCDGKETTSFVGAAGGNGDIFAAQMSGSETGNAAAPIEGFTVTGWSTGNNVNGVCLSDRVAQKITDVSVRGVTGAGSAGFRTLSQGNAGVEGAHGTALDAQNCTVALCLDGNGEAVHTSTDYGSWTVHLAGNQTALAVVHGGHSNGGTIRLQGSVGTTLWGQDAVQTLVQVGQDATDTAFLSCELIIDVEADVSAAGAVVRDFGIQGADTTRGLINCSGRIKLTDASASWSTGFITGARMSFLGLMQNVPIVAATAAPPAYKEAMGPFAFRAFDSAGIWS